MKKIVPILIGLAEGCAEPEALDVKMEKDATCNSEQSLLDVAYDTNTAVSEYIDGSLSERDDIRSPFLQTTVERSGIDANEDTKNSLPANYQWFGITSHFNDDDFSDTYVQLGHEDGSFNWSYPKEKIVCTDGTFGLTLEEIAISVVGRCNWAPQQKENEYYVGNCAGNFYMDCPINIDDPTSSTKDCTVMGNFETSESNIYFLVAK